MVQQNLFNYTEIKKNTLNTERFTYFNYVNIYNLNLFNNIF